MCVPSYELLYEGAGFEPAYAPTFGNGFDTYVYGSYQGHPVNLS